MTARRVEEALADCHEATKAALGVLQQEMAEVHRTFQAAYPGRQGPQTGAESARARGQGAGSGLLHLGQTPRTRALFEQAAAGSGGLSALFSGGADGDNREDFSRSPLAQRGRSGSSSPPEGFGPPLSTRRGGGSTLVNNVKVPSLFGPKVADEEEAGASSSPPKVRAPPGVPKLSLGGFGGGAGSKPAESKKPKLALGGGPPPLALPAAAAEAPAAPAEPPDEGSSSAQLFLQEVAILQMQAEGWKGEWSIAMQENERLRMALYDAQSALDALPEPPEGAPAPAPASLDGQMQWRELCTSIARAADEEKAMLLEEVRWDASRTERLTRAAPHLSPRSSLHSSRCAPRARAVHARSRARPPPRLLLEASRVCAPSSSARPRRRRTSTARRRRQRST